MSMHHMGEARQRADDSPRKGLWNVPRPKGGIPPSMLPKAPAREILPGFDEDARQEATSILGRRGGSGQSSSDDEGRAIAVLENIERKLDAMLEQGRQRDTGQLPPSGEGTPPTSGQQTLPAASRRVVSTGQVTKKAGPSGETVDKAIDFARILGNVLKVAEV